MPSVKQWSLEVNSGLAPWLGLGYGCCFLLPCTVPLEQRERPVAGAFLSLPHKHAPDVALATWSGCPRAGSGRAVSTLHPGPQGCRWLCWGRAPSAGPPADQWISSHLPPEGTSASVCHLLLIMDSMTVTLQMNTKWLTCSWAVVSEAEGVPPPATFLVSPVGVDRCVSVANHCVANQPET